MVCRYRPGALQHLLEPPAVAAGLRVAGLSDLMAMKLKVIGDRGELRDYFDLMVIEQRSGRLVEEGLALFVARFSPVLSGTGDGSRLRGLGCFEDVDDNQSLPGSRQEIGDYWISHQPATVTAIGHYA